MGADTIEAIPRYLAPLPRRIETVALQYAWVTVAINLAGTAFGFWYYLPQFRLEPVVAWPVVPDSPTATPPLQAVPLLGQELASNAMYAFLFVSNLGMVLQALLIHRFSDFPSRAILGSVIWYGFNDLVDYFVLIVGTPHQTLLPVEPIVNGTVQHVSPIHEIAATGAVVLTILATILVVATRRVKAIRTYRPALP